MCWQTVLALIFPCIPCKKLILKKLFLYHRSLIWSAWFWIWWGERRYQRMNWLKKKRFLQILEKPCHGNISVMSERILFHGKYLQRFCMGKMILWQHFRQWKSLWIHIRHTLRLWKAESIGFIRRSSLPFLMTGWEVLSDSLRKRWWKSAGSQFAR